MLFIFFLWYFTLQFSLPEEMIDPIKSAMFGSMKKIKRILLIKNLVIKMMTIILIIIII